VAASPLADRQPAGAHGSNVSLRFISNSRTRYSVSVFNVNGSPEKALFITVQRADSRSVGHIATFGRREECQRNGDELDDVIEAARSDGPQQAFSFANASSMGVKSVSVGGQESEVRADAFDGGADF
jgi:hypothetical protein